MMRLTLSMLRCPPSVTPETRVAKGGEFSIGRGPDNDWVLPDPDRHLSKRHCILAFRAEGWQVADLSANGTFVNGEAEPLGAGLPRRVRDGDRLRLGAFEVELQLAPEARDDRDPFALDPFAPRLFPSEAALERGALEGGALRDDAFGGDARRAGPDALQGWPVKLPADFDPLAPDPAEDDCRAPVQADHSPSTSDAFQAALARATLPDDWADAPAPASAAAPRRPLLPPVPPGAPVPPPPVSPAPVQFGPAAGPAAGIAPGEAGLLAAFLRGAGMMDMAVADPAATMEQIGQVMRELVAGLRSALIARAAVKGEFRIEQTMISARGNNPLKFAAADDDAMAALIGGARRAAMAPPAAVADALRDIRLHELATMSAMQAAVRALVASLDPVAVKREAEAGLNLPLQHKARAWEAYEALHARVSRSLTDDFDSVFGKSFARAYEQASAEIGGREGKP